MRKLQSLMIAAGALIFFAACNSASTDATNADSASETSVAAFDLAQARSAVDMQNAKFMEAAKKGDSAAMAANYTSDALLMPPNSSRVQANEIAAAWGSNIRQGVKDVKLVTDNVTGNAELLAETGSYEIYAAENKLLDKGKYVVVWKPENGTWKIYRDIWNTDLAPAKGK